MIKQVKKRTGQIVAFDENKIRIAIEKAFNSINEEPQDLDTLVDLIKADVNKKFEGQIPSVEDISDSVELVLMQKHPAVAKAYILYRDYKRQLREIKKMYIGTLEKTNLSLNAIKILEARYLLKDNEGNVMETPNQLFKRVAEHIAKVDKKRLSPKKHRDLQEKFFDMMYNLDFVPNTPTLMNAGTELGQLAACFVLPVGDSIPEIFNAIKYAAMVHQSGGGTGFSFSRLRPKGSIVKSTKGVASGPVSFMKVFDAATDTIKQGGKRRGANMGILRVDHPDILEFISCKRVEGQIVNFNISVAVTDAFMEAVENNTDYELIDPRDGSVVRRLNARAVFDLIANNAWQNGEPGVIFIDEINRHNFVPNMGTIEATNPCLIGDTLVSTEFGLMRLRDIVENKKLIKFAIDRRTLGYRAGVGFNKISHVWNNGQRNCYKIITKCGYELVGTADHKLITTEGKVYLSKSLGKRILLQSGEGKFSKIKKIPIDVVRYNKEKLNLPQTWSKELGQILGLLVARGWMCTDKKEGGVGFTFSNKEKNILKYVKPTLNKFYGHEVKETKGEKNTVGLFYRSKYLVDFFVSLGIDPSEQKKVPESIFCAPKQAVVGFLQGLFTVDGVVQKDKRNSSNLVALTSESKQLLKEVQILLSNLGIKSVLCKKQKPKKDSLYELCILEDFLDTFIKKIGFISKPKMTAVKKILRKTRRKKDWTDEIISIKRVGRRFIYNVTQPRSHTIICNGLVVAQCGEQPLLPYESCILGSINLGNMVDEKGNINWKKLEEIVRLAVRFLDNVIDANKYPIPQIESVTKSSRKIGLGVMGWADMLAQLKIPYNSDEAIYLAEKIMKFINDIGIEESVKLGEEKGNFPAFKGSYWNKIGYKNMRNATVTTIAPTGTISMIADASSGIEPYFSLAYTKLALEQEFVYLNKFLERELKQRGIYSDELMHKIVKTGMLGDIEEIPDDIKRIFVTAREIDTEWHIKMQAVFQKYTHNAVSKTINMPNNATVEDVKKAYKLAYDLKCKGITIYRDNSREVQILNAGVRLKESEQEEPQKILVQKLIAKEIPKDECPICHSKMHAQEGCYTCPNCSYSRCS